MSKCSLVFNVTISNIFFSFHCISFIIDVHLYLICILAFDTLFLYAEFTELKVEPVGKWFEKFQRCKANEFENPSLIHNSHLDGEDEESAEEIELEDNSAYLKKLDPKDWKVIILMNVPPYSLSNIVHKICNYSIDMS